MANAQMGLVVRHIRRLVSAEAADELTDGQLLEQFARRREQDAFATLLRRHGPMVLGVCRRVLRHLQDAEDAFQATFLVLARKADSIHKRESVGSWLHGVAQRLAVKALARRMRRQTQERRAANMRKPNSTLEIAWQELQTVLDEEIGRLPEKYRAPLVLCCLEGKTHETAARQLGWRLGTVAGRLARARDLLRARLGRRGLALSASSLAALLGVNAASASLPATLLTPTLKAAVQFAAGKAAAAVASAPVAALVDGGLKAMFVTKLKTATAILLALGLVTTGASLFAHQTLAAKQPGIEPPPDASAQKAKPADEKGNAAKPKPADSPKETADAVVVRGRVLDPDGKPVAGAKLSVWTNAVKQRADMPVLATTGNDGRFRFTVAKADLARDAKVVARAKDHGPDWMELAKLSKGGEATLRLAKDDVPINGRVLDLEGQPVAGVTIEVGRLEQSNLKPWLEAAKKGMSGHRDRDLAPEALDGPATVTTAKDGRFRLTGFGRDRVVFLRLRGENIEHCVFWVVTRLEPLTGFRAGPYGTYSARFDHIALPSKPIVGTVRDRATGKPVAGITVGSSYYNNRYAKTDEKGQYRIVGAGKHDKYSVSAGSAPYLNCTKMDIADTPGLEPLTVDFELDRGVAIKGRLTDKTTGKPVRGYMSYIPLADNPNIKNFSELGKLQIIASDEAQSKADGSFTVTAIPGPGVLTARADDEDRFVAAEVEGIKLAQGIILDTCHAVIPVNPSEKDPKSTHIDVALVPGRALSGMVVGADGQPLAGAHAAGLGATPKIFDQSAGKLTTANFTVSGLSPKKSRTVLVVHPEKKLAKMLTVRPDEPGPLTVRLEPTGTLAGRIVDAEGKPLAGLKVSSQLSFKEEDYKTLPADIRFNGQFWFKLITGEATTDQDGKFRVEGLVPGVKYLLNVKKEAEFLGDYTREDLTVESGKANDLGELKPKPPAKKEVKGQP